MRASEQRQALGMYLLELKDHVPLERDEEHQLAVEYQRTGRADLRRRLICGHLRLVVKIAREYRWSRHDLLELIAEGNVGLVIALGKYDPGRGVRLSSYAAWWIRAMIHRFIVDNRRLVRVGTTLGQRKVMAHLGEETAKLEREGIFVDAEVLAQRLGVSAEGLDELRHHLESSEVALDAPATAGDDTPRLALLPESGAAPPDELVERAERNAMLRRIVNEFLVTLTERDRTLFVARWGRDDQPTLKAMGDRFGITRERARQLEARLLERFRAFATTRLSGGEQALQSAA